MSSARNTRIFGTKTTADAKEGGTLTVATFTHQLLVVRDVNASIVFYTTFCGLSVLHTRRRTDRGQSVAWLGSEAASARIVLASGPDYEAPVGPYGHLGISCHTVDEYSALLRTAQKAARVERGPASQPWPICDWFSMLDPDGNRVEISFGQDADPSSDDSEVSEDE